MSGKGKRPRGLSSGRYSSMIKGYVKGARKDKGFFCIGISIFPQNRPGGSARGFPGWLPTGVDSVQVDSLDSSEESTWPAGLSAKLLIMTQNSDTNRWGGFRVDSPVRNPVASEIARSAPPYTDCAREEPSEGEAGP